MVGTVKNILALKDLPVDINAFEVLDRSNYEIQTLSLMNCKNTDVFQYLADSELSQHIESLYITGTKINSILPFENMAALTKLSINCFKAATKPLHFVHCLTQCPPGLQTLILREKVVLPASFTRQLNFVQELYLDIVDVTSNVGDLISHCFPNLTNLTLCGMVTEDVHVAFRNSNFNVVHIQMNDPQGRMNFKFGFSFKPANETEPEYYSCSYQRKSVSNPQAIQNMHLLSIECFIQERTGMMQLDRELVPQAAAEKAMCKLRLFRKGNIIL